VKIVLFSNTSWYFVKFRKNLIKSFLNQGWKVFVIASRDSTTEKLIELGCNVIIIPIDRKSLNPIKSLLFIFNIIKIFLRIKPDVICNSTIKPVIYGSFVATILRIPTINCITGLGTIFIHYDYLKNFVQWLYKISLKKVYRVFFENSDDRNLFINKQLVKKSITDVLPGSGVDLNHFSLTEYEKSKEINLLLISRIIADKGINEFVESAKIIKKKYDNVNFKILGPIDLNYKYSISPEKLKSWVQEKNIIYLGVAEDVRPYIKNAQCIILPSYREGLPNCLLESASMGRPIITTDVEGCREVVENGFNGFLCKSKDSKDLADKIEVFLSLSHDKMKLMGLNGRKKVEEKFNENIIIEKYLKTIKEISSSNL